MQTRRIGRTDLSVTEFSFGAAGQSGMRYFDVAPFYGLGLAERRVGDFLRDKPRDQFVLSTKVGRLLHPVPQDKVPDYSYVKPLNFDVTYDYSYGGIMRSVEFSYARLGLNRIDILYVHDIGVYTHGAACNAIYLRQLLEGGLKALEELKSSGTIAAYGLGVNEVPVCLDVLRQADLDCILLAGRYTLLDRSAVAELLPLCEKKQTSLVVGGVFNSGILATGPVEGAHFDYMPATEDIRQKVGAMDAVARGMNVPLAAPAMQFPLASPQVASVLLGTAKPQSLARNMALVEHRFSAADFAAFEPFTLVAPELGDEPVRV